MKKSIQFQLSFMMFLEFFIWGGWFVTLGIYLPNTLKATGGEIAMAYSTQSWGAIIAPFIIGLIADRFFNAEKILGVLHIIGAVLMYLMYQATEFSVFYPYVLGYMIAYMPTLALVNSVSFNQMSDPAKQFPKIRVWGTVGWILVGFLFISLIFFSLTIILSLLEELSFFKDYEINFIPQLFYKEIMLPFGIQSTQVHLNYMNDIDFLKFEKFVKNNAKKTINFDEVLESINNGIFSKLTRLICEKTLKIFSS